MSQEGPVVLRLIQNAFGNQKKCISATQLQKSSSSVCVLQPRSVPLPASRCFADSVAMAIEPQHPRWHVNNGDYEVGSENM